MVLIYITFEYNFVNLQLVIYYSALWGLHLLSDSIQDKIHVTLLFYEQIKQDSFTVFLYSYIYQRYWLCKLQASCPVMIYSKIIQETTIPVAYIFQGTLPFPLKINFFVSVRPMDTINPESEFSETTPHWILLTDLTKVRLA